MPYTGRMHRLLEAFTFVFCAALALIVGLTLWVVGSANRYIYASAAQVPDAQAALVLGASVSSDGTLSPVLKERADAAVELYLAHKVEKILVTGDDSTLEYNEVYPIGKYLLAAGVPEKDIFLDYAGFDTYSSMYRARDVFDVRSMIITTQRFHLPRAIYLARHLGINAVGFDAAAPGEKYLENSLREIPASLKALWDLAVRREPRYLGPQFPITGEGTQTWLGGKVQMIYFKHGN